MQKYTYVLMGLILAALLASCEWQSTLDGGDQPPTGPAELQVPADYQTIQAAIDAAEDGDVIVVAAGRYTDNGNRDLRFKGKAITLKSELGPDADTIDGGNSRRAFIFNSSEDTNSVVEGFYIIRGLASDVNVHTESCGGAVYCETSGPKFVNCVFRGNNAGFGGAVGCITASPIFENCTFISNHANRYGGNGGDGGVATSEGGSGPKFRSCEFTDNDAYGRGGAFNFSSASANFSNCRFEENRASSLGGVAFCNTSSPVFTDCIIYKNSGSEGGAIYATSQSNPALENCSIVQNSASEGGGLVCGTSSRFSIRECIIAFSQNGAAISIQDINSTPHISCTDIFSNSGGDWDGDSLAAMSDINGNFSADPNFCNRAIGDLQLKSDSPCLEDNSTCGTQIGAPVDICPE